MVLVERPYQLLIVDDDSGFRETLRIILEPCFQLVEAESGEVVYSERLRGHFSASPIYAGGLLYFCSEFGDTFLVKPGREFEVVAQNKLGNDRYGPGMMASPVAIENELILRTKDAVYCIRSK